MDQTFPKADPQRKPAIACACLIGAAMLLVAFGRQERLPPAIDASAVTGSIELKFADLPDGTVVALNAANGAEIERIAPGAGGFIRVTMRSFAAERLSRGLTDDDPFSLVRMKDGDLLLHDPVTGRRMLLNAFGPSNEGVFAALLDHGRTTK